MGMADKIKERRLAMGYTQEELAEKLGLQKSAIAKYENGRVENIKRSVISNMANILECSPAYLMGWEENIPGHKPVSTAEPFEIKDEKCTTAMNLFRELNDEGQERAIDNMVLLKKVYPRVHEPLLNAAHERTDIEVTDEMKQHDDDIIDDESF